VKMEYVYYKTHTSNLKNYENLREENGKCRLLI